MARVDALYELIHSLSQTEKRYFKLYSSIVVSNKEQNYVKVFEAIEKMKVYDEKKIVNELHIKYIAQQKQHLYSKIMESLRAYHAKDSVNYEINSLIQNFQILLDKGLLTQSRKALVKAKKLAHTHEQFTEVIKINYLESKLMHAENNLSGLNNHAKEFRTSIDEVVEKIDNQIDFESEFINIIKWNKEIEWVRNERELDGLKKIMTQAIFSKEENAKSISAKAQFHYIKGLYHFFLGEFKESASFFGLQLAHLENNPSFIDENLLHYVRCVSNYTLLNLKENNFDKFLEGFHKLESVKNPSVQVENYCEYMLILFNIMYLTNVGRHQHAVELIEKQEHKLKSLTAWIEQKDIMYVEKSYMMFKTVTAHMGVGDFKQALRHTNNYLNIADKDLKQDSYCMAIIINLLIHFELGNADLLEYNLKSTYRYFKNRKRLYKFEKVIMSFIKKAISTYSNKALITEFEKLKEDLIPLTKEKFEQNVFEYFDFISWLDSKIEDNDLSHVIARTCDSKNTNLL